MNFIVLLRIKHWLKNLLIFFVPFLNFSELKVVEYFSLFIAFIGFSLLASVVYVFNDIVDVADDRQHPVKKFRPLASGVVSMKSALALISFCLVLVTSCLIYLKKPSITYLFLLYLVLNICYTLLLKKLRWIDLLMLVVFLQIRIFIGAFFLNLPVTVSFLACISLVLFALGLKKRYVEIKTRTQINDRKIRGYGRNDLEHLNHLRLLSLFGGLIFFLIYISTNMNFSLIDYFILLITTLYLVLQLAELEGPEDVVNLILDWKTVIPILIIVFLIIRSFI